MHSKAGRSQLRLHLTNYLHVCEQGKQHGILINTDQ